jgi:hypothetical protein
MHADQTRRKSFLFNGLPLASCLPFDLSNGDPRKGRTHMQQLITFMAVVGGLVFSVAVALVVEELIFGQVFKLFFKPQPRLQAVPVAVWTGQPVRVKSAHQQ